MNTELEKIILSLTLTNSDYASKINPYLKSEFFSTSEAVIVSDLYKQFFGKYNTLPSKDSLLIEIEDVSSISQETYKNTKQFIGDLYDDKKLSALSKIEPEFILEKTEKYFRQQACHLAILESLSIIEGENKKLTTDAIPDILKSAISISFDTNIGHDYIDDAESRFEFYHKVETRIPFPLKAFNEITNGGAAVKSLVVPVAPTGIGKSFFMSVWSSYLLKNGHNVLYITLEMAEEEIAKRIDANLFDIPLDRLMVTPKSAFLSNIKNIASQKIGKLKIKEYVTGTFNANHLRHLIKELKQKENFEPQIIMIDYLNLMASYRHTNISDSYAYNKAVAEEIRGVGMEFGITICSPTQTNRQGIGAADFSLTEISESMGIAHTADFMFGLIQTEDMAKLNQMRIKQLKNRWGDINRPSSFMISVDKSKMQMFDYDDLTSSVSNATSPIEPKNMFKQEPKNELKF